MLQRLPKPEAGRPLNPLHTHPVGRPQMGVGGRGPGRLPGSDRRPALRTLLVYSDFQRGEEVRGRDPTFSLNSSASPRPPFLTLQRPGSSAEDKVIARRT